MWFLKKKTNDRFSKAIKPLTFQKIPTYVNIVETYRDVIETTECLQVFLHNKTQEY